MRHGPVVAVVLASAAAGGLVYAAVNSYQAVGPTPVPPPLTFNPAPLGELGAAVSPAPTGSAPPSTAAGVPSAKPAAATRSGVPAQRRPSRHLSAPDAPSASPRPSDSSTPTPHTTPLPQLTPPATPTPDPGTPAPTPAPPPATSATPEPTVPSLSSGEALPQAQQ